MNPKLSVEKIEKTIGTGRIGKKIIYFDTIDSTNNEGKRAAPCEPEGTVILCERQTAGRGRLGREWISPEGKGIWMSILLKPNLPTPRVPQLTIVAAAAICLALERIDPLLQGKLQVKWPNDILLGQGKISGILTEMQISGDKVQSVVVGIGLNVNLKEADFSEELKMKATSLFRETGRTYDREILIGGILNSFESLYKNFLQKENLGESLAICRNRSAVIGKQVFLLDKGVQQEAEVLELGPQGELIVKLAGGDITSIVSGEVSLRVGHQLVEPKG